MTIRIKLAVLLIILSSPCVQAQESWHCRMLRAYAEQDKLIWQGLVNQRERELKSGTDYARIFDVALANYGTCANLITSKKYSEASIYIEKCRVFLAQLTKVDYQPAALLSIEASLQAFEMVIDRKKGFILGPKSINTLNDAMKADPLSPYAWAEKGNSEYFRPALFGGSYKKAEESYKKAISLMEKDPSRDCSWYYYSVMIQWAKCLEKQEKTADAEAIWKKILAKEPGLKWAR